MSNDHNLAYNNRQNNPSSILNSTINHKFTTTPDFENISEVDVENVDESRDNCEHNNSNNNNNNNNKHSTALQDPMTSSLNHIDFKKLLEKSNSHDNVPVIVTTTNLNLPELMTDEDTRSTHHKLANSIEIVNNLDDFQINSLENSFLQKSINNHNSNSNNNSTNNSTTCTATNILKNAAATATNCINNSANSLHADFNNKHENSMNDSMNESLRDLSATASNTSILNNKRKRPTYICNICNKTYTNKTHYESHMNYELQIKPFQCEYCGKNYSSKDAAKRHKLKMHPHEFAKEYPNHGAKSGCIAKRRNVEKSNGVVLSKYETDILKENMVTHVGANGIIGNKILNPNSKKNLNKNHQHPKAGSHNSAVSNLLDNSINNFESQSLTGFPTLSSIPGLNHSATCKTTNNGATVNENDNLKNFHINQQLKNSQMTQSLNLESSFSNNRQARETSHNNNNNNNSSHHNFSISLRNSKEGSTPVESSGQHLATTSLTNSYHAGQNTHLNNTMNNTKNNSLESVLNVNNSASLLDKSVLNRFLAIQNKNRHLK